MSSRTKPIWFVILLIGSMLLNACGTRVADIAGGELSTRTIDIVATTGHVADVIRNVGGDRVVVTALMGPGTDPHLYKASANDVQALARADVIFYSGLHLEGRMIDIFERIGRTKPAYGIADDLPHDRLIATGDFEGGYDPHVWFDPTLWSFVVDNVAQRLSALDAAHAATYSANAERYKAELAALDAYAAERLAAIEESRRVLITAHDAFGYFGKRYAVDVRGLQGISTAAEAGAADVQQLAELIAERGIRAVFVESSVPQTTISAVQAAVRSRGHDVAIGGELFSDALGAADTPEGTYVGMFHTNVDTIANALGGS